MIPLSSLSLWRPFYKKTLPVVEQCAKQQTSVYVRKAKCWQTKHRLTYLTDRTEQYRCLKKLVWMIAREWAKSQKAATSSAFEVKHEWMLSHGLFLLFLKLLQLSKSLSPRSVPGHSSHFPLYPLNALLPISLPQLSLSFLFFCLHMPKIQVPFKKTINYTR